MLKKLFSICVSALLLNIVIGVNSAVQAGELSSQTPVLIQSDSTINEETNNVGHIVSFHVVNDIKDNSGKVVLPQGTQVRGTITRLEKKKRLGRPTELAISDFTAMINGKQIVFRGEINRKSESRMRRSIALSAIIIPFFLLMKGAAVELQQGTQETVYPAMDYSL